MKRIETRLSAPLIGMGLLTVAALLLMLFMIAGRVDEGALKHDEALVARGLQARTGDIQRVISPQTTWDEAVEHLDNRFDPAWARENIGAYLLGQAGFDLIFIVDQHDRPLYAEKAGLETSPDEYQPYAADLGPVLAQLRAAERGLARPTGPRADGGLVSRPVQVSALEDINGATYLITASLVQPDFGKALIRNPRAPVVVTALKIDALFLDNLASRFLLKGIHLHRGDATNQPNDAHVPLRDLSGRIIATLDWAPVHPGQRLLRKAVLPILLVVGGLVVAVGILARRSRKIAEGLIASEARAKHMALHDALTGLANRVLFEERLRQAIDGLSRRRGAVAVLAIDLDRFKAVNDTHGHAAGDQVLWQLAQRLTSAVRASDDVGRWGGEEFLVLLPESDREQAARAAERLRMLVEDTPVIVEGEVSVAVTVSIGVAIVEDPAAKPVGLDAVIRAADEALYAAKTAGRNRVVVAAA